jgi:hypothetical protein
MSSDAVGLERWLQVATRGLSDASRARIGDEIAAHVRDAIDSGDSPEQAIERLGDATEARRAFRRTNLTRFEENLVKDYRGRPPVWRIVVYGSLLLLGLGVALWGPSGVGQRTLAIGIVMLMLAAFLALAFGVAWLYRRGRERAAVFLGAMSDFVMYAGLIVGGSYVLGDATTGRTAFFGAIFLTLLVLYVPLLRKLRNEDDPERVA